MTPKAIVLDDYPPCRDLLSLILESRGFKVVCFPDANFCQAGSGTALKCPRDTPCADYLLTDNMMPGITGLELIALQEKRGCKIHVTNKAVFSGSWLQQDLDKARSFGCKTFHKPYEPRELFSWLNDQEKHASLGKVFAYRRPCGFDS